jgi:hypothetical protein
MFCVSCQFKFRRLVRNVKRVFQILSYDVAFAWLPIHYPGQSNIATSARSYLSRLSFYTYLQNTELPTVLCAKIYKI